MTARPSTLLTGAGAYIGGLPLPALQRRGR